MTEISKGMETDSYPGLTGKQLLELLQELTPEQLEKRVVVSVKDISGRSGETLANFCLNKRAL